MRNNSSKITNEMGKKIDMDEELGDCEGKIGFTTIFPP